MNSLTPRLLASVALLGVSGMAAAKAPDCSGWPTSMAYVHLKNAGIVDSTQTDPSKATSVRLASERLGNGRYRQIYRVTFPSRSGKEVVDITSSEATFKECSMGEVEVFVVSQHLGGAIEQP